MPPDAEDHDEPTDVPEAPCEPPATTVEPEPELDLEPEAEPLDHAEAERAIAAEEGPEPEPDEAEAEPGPSPFAAFAEEVREVVDRLGERVEQRLAGLQARFDREVRAEAGRERIVDRLHAELQEYKQDLVLKVQRPIFVDLIQLHDDVGKMAQALEPDAQGFRGALESIQTALEDVLYRQGVEPFRAEGDAFDPRRQRAVTTVPTSDPGLAKTIAARIRPGFQAGDKVIRPELVSVHTLQS